MEIKTSAKNDLHPKIQLLAKNQQKKIVKFYSYATQLL